MSGGHFDYKQHHIEDIIDDLQTKLRDEEVFEDLDCPLALKSYIINTIHHLTLSKIYVQRLDWFFSGDDGEESFYERTAEDISKIGKDLP